MPEDKSPFRVIIAGGGVGGLTLANSLQRANIEYLLLESRHDVAPPAGASIAVNSNGGRILDQIGALADVYEASTPSLLAEGYRNGKLFEENDSFHLSLARTGYSLNFLPRQSLLRAIYRSVPNKEKILVDKRVSRVDCSEDGVVVQCKDGTSYEGSIVVGADGVHSMVRSEMWRHMNLERPETVSSKEQHRMIADYTCMYGISKPVKTLSQGIVYRTYGDGVSFLGAVGKQNQLFWFIFKKMDQRYTVPNIPTFTTEEAEAQAQELLSWQITDQVFFQDIWEQKETFLLAPLEEAFFSEWTWGRFACIGDSVHKWTPNIGQGGNNAIESAAALANSIHLLLNQKGKHSLPSNDEVAEALKSFQAHRQARAKSTFKIACKVTRLEAVDGPIEKFLSLYLLPNSGEFITTKLAASSIGSEKLDFLPDPEKSLTGTMAFNQNYGVGRKDNMLKRVGLALPLLIIGYFCHTSIQAIMRHPKVCSQLIGTLTTGKLDFGSGRAIDMAPQYYGGISWLEQTFRPLVVVFAPSMLDIDPAHRLQMISFLADLAPLLCTWQFESHRRANTFTFARFSTLYGMAAQLRGVGAVGPLYFFLHYIQSPISQFVAFDQRLVNVAAARTALPALALAYTLPSLAMYFAPDLSVRLGANSMWQLFPVWLSLAQYVLSRVCVKDTTKVDCLHNPTTDLPSIRFAMRALAIMSALAFNWVRWRSSFSLSTVFFENAMSVFAPASASGSLDLVSGMALLLRMDQFSCALACFVWLALLFKDLKEAEMVAMRWVGLVSYAAVGAYIAGPGAVVAMGWLWREEVLASKRARGAVVRK